MKESNTLPRMTLTSQLGEVLLYQLPSKENHKGPPDDEPA